MKPYYERDGITIYHGECREILPQLEPVDLVLTDPPYGIGVNGLKMGNGSRRLAPRVGGNADWDAKPGDVGPIVELGVPTIIWGGNYFTLPNEQCWLVWDKGTGSNSFADCELAWTNLGGVVRKFFHSWVGRNAKETHEGDRFHTTQKPQALMRWCIEKVPGDPATIIDPFMGSGTTLRAAKDLSRNAIGIEIEERYCEIAAKRLGQGVLF